MELISIAGTILAFVVIIVGTILKGSTVAALWNPAAFVIVICGTFAAIMVQTPGSTLKHAASMFKHIYRPPGHDIQTLIEKVTEWSNLSRTKGLLGLEPAIDVETDEFIRNGLQLLVDGQEPEQIRRVLEVEKDTEEHASINAAKVYENAGVYSPTMGIIGAVMGLMAVMQNLTDPSKLGHGIAAAFVATIYGVGLANLLALPMSSRLRGQIHKASQSREVLIEGLVCIAEGTNPRIIAAKLRGYIE